MNSRNQLSVLLLFFAISIVFSNCASKRYTKKALQFEEAGLYKDAADYYYLAVQKKASNVEAKLGLRKNGQLKLDNKLKKVNTAYKQANYEDVVYYYLDAESYFEKIETAGVELSVPELYESYYSEAKNDFLNALYVDGLEKLKREEFALAEGIFKEIKKVDRAYKDVAEKYIVAKYEPVYRNANSFMENELYQKAYYSYDEVLREAGNYKQALSLKKEAREKGTISIMVSNFGYTNKAYYQTSSLITSGLKSQLIELNNPFITVIDEAAVKDHIYENGKINIQAANLAGIKAILSGKVLNVKKVKGKLKKVTKPGYLKVYYKTKNSEGLEITKLDYKKTQYTQYNALNTAELQIDFSVVSTENNQVIISDIYKLSKGNKLNYATFSGDKSKLVPGYWKSKGSGSSQDIIRDNPGDNRTLKNLLQADQNIKPVSALLDELIDQSVINIVDKIDDYNPE